MSKSRSLAVAKFPEHAYIGFGSNLGDGERIFGQTLESLAASAYEVLRVSDLYSSDPWGGAEGDVFVNAVLELRRHGTALDFLQDLQRIETALGRTRERRYAARTCDLDLLIWGSDRIETPDLIVPHRLMAERNFVLIPLCELIPDALHPVLKISFSELLATSKDSHKVWKHKHHPLPPNP